MQEHLLSAHIEDAKAKQAGHNNPPCFFDARTVQDFFNEQTPEQKEKIFTINDQVIIDDFTTSLSHILSLLHKNSSGDSSHVSYYKIPSETPLSLDQIDSIAVQELSDLVPLYQDQSFQQLVHSIVVISQGGCDSEAFDNHSISDEELQKFIIRKDSLLKNKSLLKVRSDSLDQFFYNLYSIINNFAKGFRHVLKKKDEEKFYTLLANKLTYQPHGRGKFVRHSIVSSVNKLYASLVAIAAIFENHLLRKFEKHGLTLSKDYIESDAQTKRATEAATIELAKGIHVGNLHVRLADCDAEEKEYNDTNNVNKTKNQWLRSLVANYEYIAQVMTGTYRNYYGGSDFSRDHYQQPQYNIDRASRGGYHSYQPKYVQKDFQIQVAPSDYYGSINPADEKHSLSSQRADASNRYQRREFVARAGPKKRNALRYNESCCFEPVNMK